MTTILVVAAGLAGLAALVEAVRRANERVLAPVRVSERESA
jgi:succinate dehydrogenase/fumarate reductase flavoprotein subunit